MKRRGALAAVIAALTLPAGAAVAKMIQSGAGSPDYDVAYQGLDSAGGTNFTLNVRADRAVTITGFRFANRCSQTRVPVTGAIRIRRDNTFHYRSPRVTIEGRVRARTIKQQGETSIVYGKVTGAILEGEASRCDNDRVLKFSARPH